MDKFKYILVVLLAFIYFNVGESCELYHGDICKDMTSHYPQPNQISPVFDQDVIESVLTEFGFKNISVYAPILMPKCYYIAVKFLCGAFFSPCDNNGDPIPICQPLCDSFFEECASILNGTDIGSFIPSCSQYPTTNCSNFDFIPPLDLDAIVCPEPLIRNPLGVPNKKCPGDVCCLSCPALFSFYPKGQMESIFLFFNIYSVICGLLLLPLIASYVVIPSKRTLSQVMIPMLAISMLIGYISQWLAFSNNTLCNNEVEEGDMTNSLCVATGVLLMFSLYSCALWIAFIALMIFLMVVIFQFQAMGNLIYLFGALATFLPVIPVALVAGRKMIMALGNGCFITGTDNQNNYVLIPLACIIFGTTALVIVTFIKIFLFHMQVYARVILEDKYVEEWFICIASGSGQSECSKVVSPYLVNIPYYVIANLLLFGIGIIMFVLFFLKADVLKSWKSLFRTQEDSTSYNSKVSSISNSQVDKTLQELTEVGKE